MLINLKVKTLDAQTHEFKDINNELTVRAFKDQIAEKTGIAPDQQRIIYCGRVLADEKPLKDFDVDGKVLHVAERPPPSQHPPSAAGSSASNDAPRTERSNRHNMRNSPLFRALDGMVLGTMAIPMNGGNANGPTALHPLTASSSFCMNRITVARHMLNCVNNIAAYLEDPSRGLNNVPLDILARGRWTMESTVVEVGITATDFPQSQNIVDMVQGAVSAALRRNGNTNVTVVQLPAMFSSSDSDALGAAAAVADLGTPSTAESSDNHILSMSGSSESDGGGGGGGNGMMHDHAVIIEDILQDIDDAVTNASSNVAQMGSTASSDSGSSHSNSTGTTDGGIGSTSVGTNTDDNIQSRRTGTNVLAEVFEQMRTVWTRMSPFIEQAQDMLQNEPTFEENDTTARENAQRLFDRVSEAFHYMSHAQHAISDLMLDYNQPTPRYLTCRPILVEQSGYVSSNNYISAAAAAAAANAFRQPQNPLQQNQQQQQQAAGNSNMSSSSGSGTSAPAAGSSTSTSNETNNDNRASDADNSNSIVEDPIDEPISASGPNRINGSSTTTSNAGTQSTDNHQLQMARLIQAVVNSAPVDTEFHVQINAPSIISLGVPVAGVARHPQRRTGGTQTPTTLTGNENNSSTATADSTPSAASSSSSAASSSTASTTTAATIGNSASSNPPVTLGNQARVNTATLPTTSTQTRSTSRPQVQIGTLPGGASIGGVGVGVGPGGRLMAPQLSAFDRFLPCNSHHIRDSGGENAANNAENGNARQSGSVTARVPVPGGIMHSHVGSTMRDSADNTESGGAAGALLRSHAAMHNNDLTRSRFLMDLMRRPSLTVGSTISAPRASAAPYTRRPTAAAATTSAAANNSNNASVAAAMATTATAPPTQSSTSTSAAAASSSSSSSMSDDTHDAALLTSLWEIPMGSSNGSMLRAQLLEFLQQTLFAGRPVNEANMEYACNRAIDWFSDQLYYLPQYERPEYDSQKSVLNILRKMWPLIVEALNDNQIDAKRYGERVTRMCDQLITRLYSVLIVCIGRKNADIFWVQLMRLLIAPVELRLPVPARKFLLYYMTRSVPIKTDIMDAGQFITYRQLMQTALDAVEIDDDDDIVRFGALAGAGDNEAQNEEKPTGSKPPPTIAAEAVTDLQQLDTEMLDLESNSSREQHGDLSDDATRFTDAASSLAQVLPVVELPQVNPGTETWHNTVPNGWIPLLTRDVQFQAQNPPIQSPYSDGYIAGMSAKRRKMIQNTKPPTADLHTLIATSTREAIATVTTAAAGVNTLPSSSSSSAAASAVIGNNGNAAAATSQGDDCEAAIAAVVGEASVQAVCKDVVRTNMRERFKSDADYDCERFPQATKFADM